MLQSEQSGTVVYASLFLITYYRPSLEYYMVCKTQR